MWGGLRRLLFWGVVAAITVREAVLDCEAMRKTREFPSPSLNSSTHLITMGQNVSLLCSHENKSLNMTYSLFLNMTYLETKKGKGDPVIFHLTISKAGDMGPYKCKAEANNCSKYSAGFYFSMEEGNRCPACLLVLPITMSLLVLLAIVLLLACLIPKYKARKAVRENLPKDPAAAHMEGVLYENICKGQAGCSQDIHYAAPVFQEVAPKELEACQDCKTPYVYSALTF